MKTRKIRFIMVFFLLLLTCFMHSAFAETNADMALLIQGDLPWHSNANIVVLNKLVSAGYYTGYDVKTANEVSSASFDLSNYKIVIFANDQSQASYNQYNNILKNKLEEYANLGGVVIFGICDRGHNNGTLSATLPGGITKTNVFQNNNYIVDSTNPVVTGKLSDGIALINSDLFGSYCSHASFVESSLPAGTKVILRGSNDNLPTLVDYTYGTGHIIASGLTWEIGYSAGWKFATKAYDDLLIYALEVANGVGKSDLTAYSEALGKITESEYTAESWEEYQLVINANKVTEENTQAEVNTATTNIIEAQNNLVKKADADLVAAKAAEDSLDEADYVDYRAVTTALSMSEGTDAEKVAKTTAINNAIAALVTKAEETELLDGAKTAAIKELNEYKESTDYSEENWVLITNMKLSSVKKINESTSPSAVTTSLVEAKVQIDEVKTLLKEKAEALAEALERAKEAAKVVLNNDLITYNATDYSEENWTILAKHKADGDVEIDASTTLLEVEIVKINAIAAIDAVKTIVETANTYVMTGYVIVEGTDNFVEGATVKLMIGSQQVEKTTTDSAGVFRIKDVSTGTYNLVISKDGQIVTTIVNVSNSDVSIGSVALPNGKKNSILDVKNDNLNIVVGNLNNFFNSNQFKDEDEIVIEDGGTVEIKLTVEEKSENNAANSVEIKDIAGSTKTIGMYIELNLSKTVTTSSAITTTGSAIAGTYAIKELQDVLIINIPLPIELQDKRDYVIYRYHGTEVQTITTTRNSDGEYFALSVDGKSITLYTKKFSTYAIGYQTTINKHNNNNNITSTVPTITTDKKIGGEVKISTDKKTVIITPEDGYVIADVLVDGKSVGASLTYTFKDSKNHNINAVFIEETALPYYMQGGKKVFIGFAAIMNNLLKYTELNGKAVEFAKNTKSFTDMDKHWAKKIIEFVTEREILLGTENSKFSPNTGMTRAMFVTAIGRLYERSYGSIKGSTTFYDVDKDAYYANYVAWANENNIINGIGENKFSPDTEVTREQMSEIMFRFAKYLDKGPTGDWVINVNYSDKSEISDWAINSVAYCQMTNIITGRDNNVFAPNDTATRAEVAAVIERFVKEMLK